MEAWQVHQLYEVAENREYEQQIGGAIVGMKIAAVNGSLQEIEVVTVEAGQIREELWDNHQFVRLTVADRRVWLDPEEVKTLIELLQYAHDASLRNYQQVYP